MNKFIVTGSNGYLGFQVCRALSEKGFESIAVVRSAPSQELIALPGIKIVTGDISELDARSFPGALHEYTLIDCAWEKGFDHSWEGHSKIVDVHLTFLNKLAQAGIARIIGIGSMHEYGSSSGLVSESTHPEPVNNYGRAKLSFQRQLRELSNIFGTSVLWVRCFYFFGSDERNKSLWTKILIAANEGKGQFMLDAATSKFDFLEISDAANMLVTLSASQLEGQINLASGTPLELRVFLERFVSMNQIDIQLVFSDTPSSFPGIWPNVQKLRQALGQDFPKDY